MFNISRMGFAFFKLKYRPDIDGLRALAVVPVILFHAGFDLFSGGFVGVDVFFVISGYLITAIILAELKNDNFSIVHFYERRARRILPVLFVVILCCLPFIWLWMLPHDIRGFAQSVLAVSTFLSNIYFWRTSGYFETATELKPLLHTWSLAVEEQFYLLFPVVLIVMWKYGRRFIGAFILLLAIVSLFFAQYLSSVKPMAAFYLLPTRAWELMIGSFIAFYYSSFVAAKRNIYLAQFFSFVGLFFICFSVFFFDAHTPFPSFYTLVPTLGAALIIGFSARRTVVGFLLSSKVAVGLGLISYSAYLWHQPLIAFAKIYTLNQLGVVVKLLLLFLTFVLSYLSWKFIERPFRSRSRFGRRFVFVSSFCGIAALVVIGFVLNGFPVSRNVDTGNREFINISRATSDWGYPGEMVSGGVDGFFVYKAKEPVDVLFFGDSHAEQYAPVAKYIWDNYHQNAAFLTGSGCPPIPFLYEDSHPHCSSLFDRLGIVLKQYNVKTLVVTGCFNCYFIGEFGAANSNSRFQYYLLSNGKKLDFRSGQGRNEAIDAFALNVSQLANERNVVVLLDNPYSYNFDPNVMLLGFNKYNHDFFSMKYPGFVAGKFALDKGISNLNSDLMSKLLVNNKIRVVNVESEVCPEGKCDPFNSSGDPIYRDGNHMRPGYVDAKFSRMISREVLRN